MAVIRWNFLSGSDGDPLTPALGGADNSSLGGGTAVISNAQSLAGLSSLSARFTITSGGNFWVAKEGLSATQFACDVYVYIATPVGGSVYILWTGASSSSRSVGVSLGPSRLSLTAGTGQNWYGGLNAVPANTWIRVSLWGNCATGETRVAWYLGHDTTPQEDSGILTGFNLQAGIDRIRYGGKAASSGVDTGDLYFGSWAYDTAATDLLPPADNSPSTNTYFKSGGVFSPATPMVKQGGVMSGVNISPR